MTKVKICGITNLEDALHAVNCGADMLGFNFYEESSRFIEPYLARDIVRSISTSVWKVGVFVNMESYRIDECVQLIGLDAVQLHGDEDRLFVQELRTETDAAIIKAVRIRPDDQGNQADSLGADLLLLDTFSDNLFGGTGTTFDWSLATKLENLILAGGLTPDNVADAITTVRPYAVDVASGVESSPGKKDPRKVEEFIEAVRKTAISY